MQRLLDMLYLAALLHDVGKISRKPEKVHASNFDRFMVSRVSGYKRCKELHHLIAMHHETEDKKRKIIYEHEYCVRNNIPLSLGGEYSELLSILRTADGLAASLTRLDPRDRFGLSISDVRSYVVSQSIANNISSLKISSLWLCLEKDLLGQNRFENVFRGYSACGNPAHAGQLRASPGFSLANLDLYLNAASLQEKVWEDLRSRIREFIGDSYEAHSLDRLHGKIGLARGQDVSLWTHSSLTAAIAVCLWHSGGANEVDKLGVACFEYPYLKEIVSVPSDGALKQISGRVILLEKYAGEFARQVCRELNLPADVAFFTWTGGVFLLVPVRFETEVRRIYTQIAEALKDAPSYLWPRLSFVQIGLDYRKGKPVLLLGRAMALALKGNRRSLVVVPAASPALKPTAECRFCGRPLEAAEDECRFCGEARRAASQNWSEHVLQTGSREIAWPYAAGVVRIGGARRLFEEDFFLRESILHGVVPARVVSLAQEALQSLSRFGRSASGANIRIIIFKPYEALVLLPADDLEKACDDIRLHFRQDKWLLPEDIGLGMWFRVARPKYPVREAFRMAVEDSESIPLDGAAYVVNGRRVHEKTLEQARNLLANYGRDDLGYVAALVSDLPPVRYEARRRLSCVAGRITGRRRRLVHEVLKMLFDDANNPVSPGWPQDEFVTAALLVLKAWHSIGG